MTTKVQGRSWRWTFWGPLLALAGGIAFLADAVAPSPTISAPARAARTQASSTRPQKSSPNASFETRTQIVSRDLLVGAARSASARDLFVARSWTPPPPPPPPATTEVPTAPPLPFTFLGKKLEGQGWEIYLSRGEQTLVVKRGTVLDGVWRADQIEPPLLSMTYLPLGQSRSLPIGDSP